jgi:undecaprenyl-diphosphatase
MTGMPQTAQSAEPLGATAALVLGGSGVAALAAIVAGGEPGWDRAILRVTERLYDVRGAVFLAHAYVEGGMVAGLVLGVALLVALVIRRDWGAASFWLLAVGGALVASTLIKEVVRRPSLGDQSGFSFPSGNAAATAAAVLALVCMLPSARQRLTVALVGAAAVPVYGFALVLIGWHYPSDVVGGWSLAVALVAALRLVYRRAVTPKARPRPGTP